MDDETLFFGYGVAADQALIEKILGRSVEPGVTTTINGFDLCVQGLKDIPLQAQSILTRAYGENFSSYTLRKGSGKVEGKLWRLKPGELSLLREWNLIYTGWRKEIEIPMMVEGRTVYVISDMADESLHSGTTIEGSGYEKFLVPKEKIYQIAEGVHQFSKEGKEAAFEGYLNSMEGSSSNPG